MNMNNCYFEGSAQRAARARRLARKAAEAVAGLAHDRMRAALRPHWADAAHIAAARVAASAALIEAEGEIRAAEAALAAARRLTRPQGAEELRAARRARATLRVAAGLLEEASSAAA